MTIFLDNDFRIKRFMPVALDTWHLKPSDLGKSITDLAHAWKYDTLREDATKVLQCLETVEREVDGTNGSCFLVRIAPYYTPAEEVDGLIVTLVDLTRYKTEKAFPESRAEMERQFFIFNTTLSSITDFAYIFDREGRFMYSNQALLDLLGITPDEIIGKNFFDLHYPADLAARLQRQIQQVIDSKKIIKDETPFTSPTGASGFYEYIFSPVIAADGQVEAVAGSTRDITELKKAEEALKDAARKKNEFLATLAHELRNPLTPIQAALQVIDQSGDPEKEQEARRIIKRQIRKLVILIDDLLEISRITQGKIRLRKQRIALQDVVTDAVETTRPLMTAAGHQFMIRLPTEPTYLDADKDRVAQIIINLLSNAIKYTHNGGRLSLTVTTEEKQAVLRLKDNGVGIPPDQLKHIFELFSQIEQSGKKFQTGLGIGLSVVQKLVELHDGAITAYSKGEGKGSEFVLRLPLAEVQTAPETAPPVERLKAPVGESKLKRILVVEDDFDIAAMLQVMLDLEGYTVQTANNGENAIKKAAVFRPDIALVDIGLPDIDGYEVGRRLRRQYADLLLIAHSGWGAREDRQKSKEAGFNYHLVKPAEVEEMVALFTKLGG